MDMPDTLARIARLAEKTRVAEIELEDVRDKRNDAINDAWAERFTRKAIAKAAGMEPCTITRLVAGR